MKILPKNEEHLGGVLCYPCKQWIVYGIADIQKISKKIYKTINPSDIESDGYWEDLLCNIITCPTCNRKISVTIIR